MGRTTRKAMKKKQMAQKNAMADKMRNVKTETAVTLEETAEEIVEEVVEQEEEKVIETVEEPVTQELPVQEELAKKMDFYLIIQYYGKEMNVAELMNQVKASANTLNQNLEVYIKVEDNRAYYVVDGQSDSGKVELWNGTVSNSESYDLDAPGSQNIYFQFRGKEVKLSDMLANINDAIKKAAVSDKGLEQIDKLELYVKFEDETVYYLVNNSIDKKIGMFS